MHKPTILNIYISLSGFWKNLSQALTKRKKKKRDTFQLSSNKKVIIFLSQEHLSRELQIPELKTTTVV